ncbi:MAG: hypothetical protein Q8P59_04970 [Dehalococcoidia bacterium]|nr:hypothetical protein [Dehalococcoidia bacterium]
MGVDSFVLKTFSAKLGGKYELSKVCRGRCFSDTWEPHRHILKVGKGKPKEDKEKR